MTGFDEDGREETAEDAEDRDHLRFESHGEEEGRAGDEHHEQERGNRAEGGEVVNRAARERDRVEADDTGRDQGLRGDGVARAVDFESADDEAEGEEKADGDADLGGNEIVVEGVFDEETDGEQRSQAAEPREEFRAHKLFPVDGRCGGLRWCGWCERRRCGEERGREGFGGRKRIRSGLRGGRWKRLCEEG